MSVDIFVRHVSVTITDLHEKQPLLIIKLALYLGERRYSLTKVEIIRLVSLSLSSLSLWGLMQIGPCYCISISCLKRNLRCRVQEVKDLTLSD